MERLDDSLFNHMRGFLSYRKIHATRPVSSRWTNIDDVPKVFDESSDPPARACFKNVIKFKTGPDDSILSMSTTDRIFSESRNTLRFLHLYRKTIPTANHFIPPLPNVRDLVTTCDSFNEALLKSCPNLYKLLLVTRPGYVINVDFRALLNITTLFVIPPLQGTHNLVDLVCIKNLSTYKSDLNLSLPWNVNGATILEFLNQHSKLCIAIQFPPTHEKVFEQHALSMTKDEIIVSYDFNATILKDWLTKIKVARNLPVTICKDLDVKQAFSIASALAQTGLFTKQELKNMI